MLWLRLFLPFAGAYFLSYHFRTANAVVGPLLSVEFGLNPADLGLLTSAYFLTFSAAQLPLGVLLDRFGARRVEASLLVIAALGAFLFARGESISSLAFARGLIGLGVSACLMASFKSFSQWFSPEQQASLTGWMMTAGTLGALAASMPLELALQFMTWREIFIFLGLITLVLAACLFIFVPEKSGLAQPEALTAQWSGLKQIFSSRHFWRYAPMGFTHVGGFMAVQTLWASAWLMQVDGLPRALAAEHLAALFIAMMTTFALIGLLAARLARHGISPVMLLRIGLAFALLSLLLIICQVSEHHLLLWIAYGSFSSFASLIYSQSATGFPLHLSGRANTSLNLLVFFGAFCVQWGMGVLITALLTIGWTTAGAYRAAFLALFALQAASYLWFCFSRQPNKHGASASTHQN